MADKEYYPQQQVQQPYYGQQQQPVYASAPPQQPQQVYYGQPQQTYGQAVYVAQAPQQQPMYVQGVVVQGMAEQAICRGCGQPFIR
jgi:hypothetical protein